MNKRLLSKVQRQYYVGLRLQFECRRFRRRPSCRPAGGKLSPTFSFGRLAVVVANRATQESAAARGGQQATPRRRLLGRFKPSRVHFKMARVWVAVCKASTKEQVFDNKTVAAPKSEFENMMAFYKGGNRVIMLYDPQTKTVVGPLTAQQAPVSTLRSSVL